MFTAAKMEKGLKVEGDGDKWRHLKVGRIDEQGKKKKKRCMTASRTDLVPKRS